MLTSPLPSFMHVAGTLRVWANGAVGLAMSRSLGDGALKGVGVIAAPEVWHHTISDDDLFVLIASDGIWQLVLSHAATAPTPTSSLVVTPHPTPHQAFGSSSRHMRQRRQSQHAPTTQHAAARPS